MKRFIPITMQLSGVIFFIGIILIIVLPAYAGSFLEKKDVSQDQGYISLQILEIGELKENLEWLERKIKKMDLLDRPVSDHLLESVSFKKLRIAALEKDLQNYIKDLKQKNIQNSNDYYRNHSQAKLIDQIKKSDIFHWFELIPEQHSVKLRTTRPIFFTSGSAVVAREYEIFLKKISSFVKKYNVWIMVSGFTDKDPIGTKQFPSNFELGAIRAANVVHLLINYGVNPSVFKVVSTGEYRFGERPVSSQKEVERYVDLEILFKG